LTDQEKERGPKKVKAGQKNASTVAGVSTIRKICNQLTPKSSKFQGNITE
jgi:hypothetical protein